MRGAWPEGGEVNLSTCCLHKIYRGDLVLSWFTAFTYVVCNMLITRLDQDPLHVHDIDAILHLQVDGLISTKQLFLLACPNFNSLLPVGLILYAMSVCLQIHYPFVIKALLLSTDN